MAAIDEDDRMTPRLPAPDAVIISMLADVRATLAARPADAHTRALLAKAESYERAMDRWSAVPPSVAQRGALTDLVEELRDRVERDDEPPPSNVRVARVPLTSKSPKPG